MQFPRYEAIKSRASGGWVWLVESHIKARRVSHHRTMAEAVETAGKLNQSKAR